MVFETYEDYEPKKGSLLGGSRKAFCCLSLRLSTFLYGILQLLYAIETFYFAFIYQWDNLLHFFEGGSVTEICTSLPRYEKALCLYVTPLLAKVLTPDLAYRLEFVLSTMSYTSWFWLSVMFFMGCFFFIAVFSAFGSILSSVFCMRISIFLTTLQFIYALFLVFTLPRIAIDYGVNLFRNTEFLVGTSIFIVIAYFWALHLLLSLYKVLRVGGKGDEFKSYREIVDKRNFMRWRTWREREVERSGNARIGERTRLIA